MYLLMLPGGDYSYLSEGEAEQQLSLVKDIDGYNLIML